MKILVTGATGFVGKNLCNSLESLGNEVVKISTQNCDLRICSSLNQFNRSNFDQIYHLAAWTQAGDFCLYHPGEQWIINQEINTNMLSWWSQRQPQAKLITLGTSCSYDPTLPMNESMYLIGQPIDSLYTYAMTKRMLQVGVEALSRQYNLKYLTCVPSTLYGPYYHNDGRQMHFIFDLIRKILKSKKNGEKVVLWGNGYQKRELVYVQDFVDKLIILGKQQENTIVNIGSGQDHSIREFAKFICDIVGYDSESIEYDQSRYTGALSKILNIEKLNSYNLAIKNTNLIDGLTSTIEWFDKNITV